MADLAHQSVMAAQAWLMTANCKHASEQLSPAGIKQSAALLYGPLLCPSCLQALLCWQLSFQLWLPQQYSADPATASAPHVGSAPTGKLYIMLPLTAQLQIVDVRRRADSEAGLVTGKRLMVTHRLIER